MRGTFAVLRNVQRLVLIGSIVLLPMSVNWNGLAPIDADAQNAGPTGWCTDHDGRNFRCGSGGGGSMSGGGGCAQTIQAARQADAEARNSAVIMSNSGIKLFEEGDFTWAAGSFESAINQDPSYQNGRDWLGHTYNRLGVEASKRGDMMSALLYYERALEYKDSQILRDNRADAARAVGSAGGKTCALCGKALISDIGYGINSSAEFSNYSSQARANFANCKRHLPGLCDGTTGKRFDDQLHYCNRTFAGRNMNSYKACVRQALSDAGS